MNAKTITLRLELDPADDSLSGRAIDADGEREFHGWLGLIGVIDSLLDEARTNRAASGGHTTQPPAGDKPGQHHEE